MGGRAHPRTSYFYLLLIMLPFVVAHIFSNFFFILSRNHPKFFLLLTLLLKRYFILKLKFFVNSMPTLFWAIPRHHRIVKYIFSFFHFLLPFWRKSVLFFPCLYWLYKFRPNSCWNRRTRFGWITTAKTLMAAVSFVHSRHFLLLSFLKIPFLIFPPFMHLCVNVDDCAKISKCNTKACRPLNMQIFVLFLIGLWSDVSAGRIYLE